MPAALERKLKAKVAGKKMSKERKDAFVYGTMRKTGWKPSREKKMNSAQKLVRLAHIDQDLESIIRFDYRDDDSNKPYKYGAIAAGGAGLGVAGVLGHQAVKRYGGYAENLMALRRGGQDLVGQATGNVAAGAGKIGGAVASGASKVGSVFSKFGGKVWNAARRMFMESKEEAIEFAELPAVGSSLERLRGIVRGAGTALENRVSNREAGQAYAGLRNMERNPYWKRTTRDYPGAETRHSGARSGMNNPLWQPQQRKFITKPVGTLQNTSTQSLFSDRGKPIEFGNIQFDIFNLLKKAKGVVSGEARMARIGRESQASKNIHEAWLKTLPKERQDFFKGRDKQFSDRSKPIQFDASILGPWQGSKGHESKIDQLEFPAGLSPAAALKFPLPVLMRYLNQRNLQQQLFSWKTERLVQLSAKLDEINA